MSIAGDEDETQPELQPGVRLARILTVSQDQSTRTPAPYVDESYDLPEYAGRVRGYIVAATERSGSTLLCDLLYRSGCMGVPAEYFSSRPVSVPLARRFDTFQPNGMINMPLFIRTIMRRRTSPNGIFGVNLHHWHMLQLLPRPSTSRLLRNGRYIWLRRRDLLGQAISLAIARRTDEWYRPAGAPAPEVNPPPNLDDIRREIAYLTYSTFEWERIFAANGITPLEILYEDLIADTNRVCREVCRFVGLKDIPDFNLTQAGYARQSGPANAIWRAAYEDSLKIVNPRNEPPPGTLAGRRPIR